MIVTLVLCVDRDTDWGVVVQEDGVKVFRVDADPANQKLAKTSVHGLVAGKQQTVHLKVGVYLLSTALPVQHQASQDVRVQVYGGKSPWPPPPPPAPQASDLSTTHAALYTMENLGKLGPGGTTSWIEVRGMVQPEVVVAPENGAAAYASHPNGTSEL